MVLPAPLLPQLPLTWCHRLLWTAGRQPLCGQRGVRDSAVMLGVVLLVVTTPVESYGNMRLLCGSACMSPASLTLNASSAGGCCMGL